ncbi:MAG: hypothetical protein N2110_05275 [Flavobacteriales bacterium]|nr:hypothetical protein [Flavobacteriales bacterium]MCX7768417.1 hypothetical protein [Flavobacteriales bacterium]MDW8409690.1 hypothetical protein [Flavobacteriales bacterium]
MKKISTFATAVMALSLMVSCEKPGPEAAVKNYLTALKDKKVDEAKKYSTESTQNMLDALNQLKMLPEITEIKDIKCDVKDTAATCTFCCMKEGKNELKLVKRGEKWLVDEKKESAPDMNAEQPADTTSAGQPAAEVTPAEGNPAAGGQGAGH